MPNLRIPRQSGPHRIAAIALYRALLTQCRAVPLEETQREELQNIVRNRFKQARRSQSSRLLSVSFQAGYEAIDHLDAAAAGNVESKRYVGELLERAPARIKVPPAPFLSAKKSGRSTSPADEKEEMHQRKLSIFDRPLPLEQLSGKRHVPVLFNANHIPVLRIKKPQPASLSRFLRQRIQQRQNRHDRRWRLYSDQEVARKEDEWDNLVAATLPNGAVELDSILSQAINGNNNRAEAMKEPSWTKAIDDAIEEVQAQLNEEREKNRVMAVKMQAVVDRESELFQAEKRDRLRLRRREYRQRKIERESSKESHSAEKNAVDTRDGLSCNG